MASRKRYADFLSIGNIMKTARQNNAAWAYLASMPDTSYTAKTPRASRQGAPEMAANMTTPRPHAELAARYYADDTLKCWTKDGAGCWVVNPTPWFGGCEYHVGHEPPSIKRTITLVVNGREWVLPEPLKEAPLTPTHWEVNYGKAVECGWYGHSLNLDMLQRRLLYSTEADAKAWAEFDKWCRMEGRKKV